MAPDSLGSKDFMAVVVSTDSLDWNLVNKQIGQNPQQDYASRLNTVLANKEIRNVSYEATAKGNMHCKAEAHSHGLIGFVVAIDKH
jgi:hypothetical protein